MSFASNWIRHFSIRLRMQGAIAVVLALFGLVGATSLLGGRHLSQLNEDFMTHSIKEVHDVANVRQALAQVRVHEKNMVIYYEDGVKVLQERELWQAQTQKVKAALNALLEGEDDEDNPRARAALGHVDQYLQLAGGVLDQMQNGAYDSAKAADKLLESAKGHVRQAESQITAIEEIVDAEAAATQAEFEMQARRTLWTFLAVIGLVVLVVVPLTLLNSRSIVGPIQHAREVALAIAEGDLTRRVHKGGRDEVAQLLGALDTMQAALQGLVGSVRDTSQSIQHASNEVASGNNDLSQRTEQAAGSLQATVGAMAQLTSNVQHSASAAGHADELAASASSVARRGGEVVSQVVHTMEDIHGASRRIADIIGVIDGIAFQTNILALNAAVEAARAGEQGRGFAVVASEVRSLAGRSADAAREIKTLIQASVEKIDGGTRLVQDAGQTMSDIVNSVQRVTDTIRGITTAAHEQSQGIGQINSAIGQLDQMTQQNAALVEQSAAAAESLKDQASQLNSVAARFRTA